MSFLLFKVDLKRNNYQNNDYNNTKSNRGGDTNYQTLKESNYSQMIQTRSQRVRAAMFPETLEDIGSDTTEQQTPSKVLNGRPTAIQRLAGPSQMLKTAIVDLINYLDDATAAQKSIPEIIKLLNDEDKLVVQKAIAFIEQLSNKDASKQALANSQPLINALINLLNTTNDPQMQRNIASALHHITSDQPSGIQLLFKSGGIAALIKLLSSPIDTVVYYATTTLHNLLIYEENSKVQIRKCGGIQKMVALMQTNTNQKFLAILLDCLHMLAYNNAESKLIIAASGGPKELVRILHNANYEKLLWTAIRLMKVLSICSSNKPALIKSGAIQVLTEHIIKPVNNRILINCLLTLRNLSDCAINEDNLDVLIKRLVDLLESNVDLNLSICAAGILSNLTCNNELNKIKFVEYNGIETMIRTMVQSKDDNFDDIYEPIVCSLRHVTNRNECSLKAQESIRYNYGLPAIVKILQSENNKWPLLKACIGLTRNLSLSENNLVPLRELGIIPRLVQLLIKAVNILQQAEVNNQEAVIDDVPMEEIIEGSVGALHQLSRDIHNRIIIRELKCIPLLVQLLYMSWESIQRVACGTLCELANDKESIDMIESEQVTDKLTELLRSKDDALATYAAAVLYRLSEDKPQQQQQQQNSFNRLNVNNGSILIQQRNGGQANIVDYGQYNAVNNPYELEMKPQHANGNDLTDSHPYHQYQSTNTNQVLINPQQQSQQQQQPASWFDTDL